MPEIPNYPPAFAAKPCGPRTYKPLRQRTRARFADPKLQFVGTIGEEAMDIAAAEDELLQAQAAFLGHQELINHEESLEADDQLDTKETEIFNDRETLCLPHFERDEVVHKGDAGFQEVLQKYFLSAESNASEKLVELKSKLKDATTQEFWEILMEGMCGIMGAQCGFVAKRMLVDDQDSAVEMPPLGEPGSCLMGVAFYVNDGVEKQHHRDYRYHAYGTPCAHMRYDKVFIVPERMGEFVPNNPNPMPWKQSEAFIGVPLFTEGKCFAHFGMIWSLEGAKQRPKCSWSFIEMFLHSLEDMILERILGGRGFAKDIDLPDSTPAKVIPLSAITASQSLKPYARSLSHELRTPMQGVVGMLDIMYSTVLDAIANQHSERARSVFKDLKAHIEVVQDSSRRAVEAADNVVHAYDLNMQMPDTPLTPNDPDTRKSLPIFGASVNRRSPQNINKRRRSEEVDSQPGPAPKRRLVDMVECHAFSHTYASTITGDAESAVTMMTPAGTPHEDFSDQRKSPSLIPAILSPSHRQINTRDFIRNLVYEALRNGHPTNEVHKDTELGEVIEVQTVGSRGEIQRRTISLEIDTDVPAVIITEEQFLQFALQKLVDNAIKFTEDGRIRIAVKIAAQVVEIWVVDTGCGIAEDSRSHLFTPHFQEDASISRSKDGLGLSLFNAKAQVRKNLGGDVTLERSNTEGPSKGSEFLIRLPISTLDTGDINPPLVGTPLTSTQNLRPLLSSEPTLARTESGESQSPSPNIPSRASTPKPSSTTKRNAINQRLAEEYPLNILIAEDNPTNRNVAIGALKRLGYSTDNITVAFDGSEAVKYYKASLDSPPEQRYNAVLMDIWMPNMDGYEATKQIVELAKQRGQDTRVMAVTADITPDCFDRAKAAGMLALLAKPYKVLDMERLIVENYDKYC